MSYTLSKTGAQLDAIGEVVDASSTATSIADSTYVNLCSVSLTAGVWVVIGQVRINPGVNDVTLDVSLSNTSGDITIGTGGLSQQKYIGNSGIITVNVTRIAEVASGSTQTVYLVARQISGGAKEITGTRQIIRAVRIK